MIRIAIVEDEDLYADQLKEYLDRYEKESGNELSVVRFTDGDEIVEKYTGDYHIILMDIQMRFLDGMTAAERIRSVDPDVIIVFITNCMDYAIRGYSVNALDYIVKPIEYFSFSQKLSKAVDRLKGLKKNYLVLPVHTGVCKVDIDRIRYIESNGHTLTYHTLDGEIASRGVMKDAEEALEKSNFFRCGKGYLVNLKYVERIQDSVCVMDGETVPVSRAKKQEFLNRLVDYMSES